MREQGYIGAARQAKQPAVKDIRGLALWMKGKSHQLSTGSAPSPNGRHTIDKDRFRRRLSCWVGSGKQSTILSLVMLQDKAENVILSAGSRGAILG